MEPFSDMVGLGNGLYLWSYREPDGWRGEITDAEPNSQPLHIEKAASRVKMIGACARWLNEQLNGQPAHTAEAQP